MKKIMMILVLLMVASGGYAWEHDPWTIQDTVLQSVFVAFLTIDVLQTYTFLYTSDNPCKEGNPILDEHPSKKKFFAYNSICLIGHTFITYLLPKSFRTIWQSIFITTELSCISYNYYAGVRISF
jgi:hypothetical protein